MPENVGNNKKLFREIGLCGSSHESFKLARSSKICQARKARRDRKLIKSATIVVAATVLGKVFSRRAAKSVPVTEVGS